MFTLKPKSANRFNIRVSISMILFLLFAGKSSIAQFGESHFYDTLTRQTGVGYVRSAIADGKYIYVSGNSFSDAEPMPTLRKLDTAGNLVWTCVDYDNYARFKKYYSNSNNVRCGSTYKLGGLLYTTVLSPSYDDPLGEVWCVSDTTGALIWKADVQATVQKIVDYSPTELLVISGQYNYVYRIINKITGEIVFTKQYATHGSWWESDPDIFVDKDKNILLSWDDSCKKFKDKYLTQLSWMSHIPSSGTTWMIDKVIQDSGRYLFMGLSSVRAVDTATGNSIWKTPIKVGYIQGQYPPQDCSTEDFILKDSILYITWRSPLVGGLDFDRGFTLSAVNTTTGNIKFNVSYDLLGVPPDPGPSTMGEMDWPVSMSMDDKQNIYMTGSYDNSAGTEDPGNWGIMKLSGITGNKIYEATITSDSTERMGWAQGRFIYYYNGKMYCVGNLQRKIGSYLTSPVVLQFDTTATYNERYRKSIESGYRYPSSLAGMVAFGPQKMSLLKKVGRSATIELRTAGNQPIWSTSFSSTNKFIVPQNIKSIGDTAIAASFMLYPQDAATPILMKDRPDSLIFVKLDASGNLKFRFSIKVNDDDTLQPIQIYGDKTGVTNFIFKQKKGTQYTYRGYMLGATFTALGGWGQPVAGVDVDFAKMRMSPIANFYQDTIVYFQTNIYNPTPVGWLSGNIQDALGYTFKGFRNIRYFAKIFSTLQINPAEFLIMGKDSSNRELAGRLNLRAPNPWVWLSPGSSSGAMFNADTSSTAMYGLSLKPNNSIYLSKLNRDNGNIMWGYTKAQGAGTAQQLVDFKYNPASHNFIMGGYIIDSATSGTKSSYFYVTVDSSGNVIKDLVRSGDQSTGTRINVVEALQNGTQAYGGAINTSDKGIVGFYISDCTAPTLLPEVNITSTALPTCPGSMITFTATAINEGAHPIYQWKVNGVNVGTNSNVFSSSSLNNNDAVIVYLTSDADCLITNTDSSNIIKVITSNNLVPTVAITASNTTICTGAAVTFTAAATNQGNNPTYQWKLNGNTAGTNSDTFTSNSIKNNDKVQVIMTSNASCVTAPIATSNIITMTVTEPITPAITISSSTTFINQLAVLKALPSTAGNTPTYQWQDSTAIHGWQNISGATTVTVNYTALANKDKVRCIITSNANCSTGITAYSTVITFKATGIFDWVTFYPNPVIDVINIEGFKPIDHWQTAEIFSFEGRRLIGPLDISNQTSVGINIKDLIPGFYVIVVRTFDDYYLSYKFVKL